MKISKIKSEPIFVQNPNGLGRIFNGIEVSAEFINQAGYTDVLTFHYDYVTNNMQGLVEKVLHTVFRESPPPKYVSSVRVIPL